MTRAKGKWSLVAAPLLFLASMAGAQVPDTSVRPAGAPDTLETRAARIGPPIRRIATASAMSTESFGALTDVMELPGNRVLVNDGQRRQLLLLDTMLRRVGVVLDSMSESENTYGTRAGALIPYRADSSLFIDPSSLALLILDPEGRVARVRSVPRVQDVQLYANRSGGFGRAGTDARGRLVYRIAARPAEPIRRPPRGVPYIPPRPDSAFIVGIDLETRRIDTLGSIRIPRNDFVVRMSPNGGVDVTDATNPLPLTDEWAVLSDGSVAFVRGIDYRVDYLNPDGTRTSSAKLPYEWQPLSDAQKKHIVDSVKAEQTRTALNGYTSSLIRWVNQYGKRKYPEGFAAPAGYRVPQGLQRDWALPSGVSFPANYIYACAPGEEPTLIPRDSTGRSADSAGARVLPSGAAGGGPQRGAGGAQGPGGRGQGGARGGNPGGGNPGRPGAAGRDRSDGEALPARVGDVRAEIAARLGVEGAEGGMAGGRPSCIPAPIPNTAQVPPAPRLRETGVIAANDLPHYKPPFAVGAVRADADGNLWVRTILPQQQSGGAIYDIISRSGELIDRIQLPQTYQLVGFGAGRVVYLSMRDAGGIRLARVLLR